MKYLSLSIASFTAITLTACTTIDQKLMDSGATRLNGAQVNSHLTNRTERWTKGGGFYDSAGEIKVVWKGDNKTGTWGVSDDGKVCVQVPTWDEFCHHYLDNKGEITLIFKKNGKTTTSVKEMFNGNQLANL